MEFTFIKEILTDTKEKSRSSHWCIFSFLIFQEFCFCKPSTFQGTFLLTVDVKIGYLRLSVSSNQFSSECFQQQGVIPAELLLFGCFILHHSARYHRRSAFCFNSQTILTSTNMQRSKLTFYVLCKTKEREALDPYQCGFCCTACLIG